MGHEEKKNECLGVKEKNENVSTLEAACLLLSLFAVSVPSIGAVLREKTKVNVNNERRGECRTFESQLRHLYKQVGQRHCCSFFKITRSSLYSVHQATALVDDAVELPNWTIAAQIYQCPNAVLPLGVFLLPNRHPSITIINSLRGSIPMEKAITGDGRVGEKDCRRMMSVSISYYTET